MTAAEAVGLMMGTERRDPVEQRKRDKKRRDIRSGRRLPGAAEGYEVIIPRRIETSEILRIKSLPQVVGWRYQPGANGTPPCTCLCCRWGRGVYGTGKLLRAVEEAEARGRETKINVAGREADSFKRVEKLRQQREQRKQQRKQRRDARNEKSP
jgi:hypothetical protein